MSKPFHVSAQGVDSDGMFYLVGLPDNMKFLTATMAIETAIKLSAEMSAVVYVGCDMRTFLEFYQGQLIHQKSWEDFYTAPWSDNFVELFTAVAKRGLGVFGKATPPPFYEPVARKEG